MRDDNEQLDKRVMALEIECAALADRLIQVGVSVDKPRLLKWTRDCIICLCVVMSFIPSIPLSPPLSTPLSHTQGQVTRAQEAEEMFITRREVSRLRKQLKALKEETVINGREIDRWVWGCMKGVFQRVCCMYVYV